MVSLGKLSLNKYTVINNRRSMKWFIRQALRKLLNSYNSLWDCNVLDFNYIPRAFLICILRAGRTWGLHPLGTPGIIAICVKLKHSYSMEVFLEQSTCLLLLYCLKLFIFGSFPTRKEFVCREMLLPRDECWLRCLKQQNHGLIWITFFEQFFSGSL